MVKKKNVEESIDKETGEKIIRGTEGRKPYKKVERASTQILDKATGGNFSKSGFISSEDFDKLPEGIRTQYKSIKKEEDLRDAMELLKYIPGAAISTRKDKEGNIISQQLEIPGEESKSIVEEEQQVIPETTNQTQEKEGKGFIQKAAEIGVTPGVIAANLISKGLSLAGINIGTTTAEEIASTKVGKTLGIITDLAALAVVGKLLVPYAASLITSSTAAGTVTARTAVAAAVTRTSLLAKLTSAKTIAALATGGFVVSTINGRISDLETSVVNQRESLTLVGSLHDAGGISTEEAILLFDEIEDGMNESERAIQHTSIFSIKAWLGKGREVQTRMEKAKLQLAVERAKLIQQV